MSKKTITENAITELQKINWTGNIREFRNVIERLIILCDQQITEEDVLKFAAPLK
jgi:DNA-binding NtrC family response regulator